MDFQDPVYGRRNIEEPVLKQLVSSDPVQRLKKINQAGPSPYFMEKDRVYRFDHSLGVMFLLRLYDAPLEEQVAGLLHDIPHTAFSHLVDFVFDRDDHEYHEDFMEEVVYSSDIPDILDRHGIETDYILDESNFPLLEQDMPRLCADRIDYFLRDTLIYSGKDLSPLLQGLRVMDNEFAVEDVETAEEFALEYIQSDEDFWAHPREVAIFEIMAEVMKEALEAGLITEEDLFRTDEEVMRVLRNSGNSVIRQKLETLENLEIELDPEDYDFRGETKARFIDPPVIEEGMTPVSEISEEVARRIDQHRKEVESGYCIKVLNR